MNNIINVLVLNKKLVKPCVPTPPNLKNYKLSFQDQFMPLAEVGVLLFYSSKNDAIDLEESLARVLVHFYPLAGRLFLNNDTNIVDCSDQGAEFIKAEAAPDVELASLIVETDLQNLYGFLPNKNRQINIDVSNQPLLSIQATSLKRGGLVIGITVSHKIFDASSLATFLAAWSSASNPELKEDMVIGATFDTSSILPGRKENPTAFKVNFDDYNVNPNHDLVVKRFSFNERIITSLRSSLRPNKSDEHGLSKVRVVCALIASALIRLDRAKYARARDCLVSTAVNIRGRTIPSLHKHMCGNLVLLSVGRCNCAVRTEGMVGMQELCDLIGDATRRSISDCAKMFSLGEDERNDMLTNPMKSTIETCLRGETNSVNFSDYSKFGFYEADFGWGKPVWASIAPHPHGNITVLMSNKGGDGIEAWVHLDKNDMLLFEQDQEISRLFAA